MGIYAYGTIIYGILAPEGWQISCPDNYSRDDWNEIGIGEKFKVVFGDEAKGLIMQSDINEDEYSREPVHILKLEKSVARVLGSEFLKLDMNKFSIENGQKQLLINFAKKLEFKGEPEFYLHCFYG